MTVILKRAQHSRTVKGDGGNRYRVVKTIGWKWSRKERIIDQFEYQCLVDSRVTVRIRR
jgi:hypothetical protein